MVEVDERRYHHNKCDLTLRPQEEDASASDSHSDDHNVPMTTGVMPTVRPRPQLKFPNLPVQAMEQRVFYI